MPSPTDAHRSEFSVRCVCGIAYHTNDSHIGRLLPCKCGRQVEILRPPATENTTRNNSTARRAGSSSEPQAKRRRTVRKRRFVPSEFALKFGKAGVWADRANVTSAQWLGRQLQPMFVGSFMERSVAISSWLMLLGTTIAWVLLKFFSEETIPAAIIAYGPRFVALWPLVLLVPVALLFLRRALWLLAITALIIVFPIMGYVVNVESLGSKPPRVPAPGTFRMLTFNVESGNALSYDLAIMLKEEAPDVFTFQECDDKLAGVIKELQGWYSERYGSLCTGSRWKIESTDVMPREEFARISKLGFGGAALVLRTFIQSPHGPLVVVNLHLETARRGLEGLLGSQGIVPDNNPFNKDVNDLSRAVEDDQGTTDNAGRFRKNATIRDAESDRASRWAVSGVGDAPVLIAGDFNLPVESTIFQQYWGKFVDAFETRGNGLGWTKREGRWLRIRIDHILSPKGGLEPQNVVVGPDYRSDHLPLIADYAWPATATVKP
ncbi:MAG: endonuclease/exonuclease/phosphatase family protein [Gemmatimonas sp.]